MIHFKFMISIFKWALKLPSRSLIFLLLTSFPVPREDYFLPSFPSQNPLHSFLYSHTMTSHFMGKIEKSSSLHQTCNLHWDPFSHLFVLLLKWKQCSQAYHSPIHFLSALDLKLQYCPTSHISHLSLALWMSPTCIDILLPDLLKQKEKKYLSIPSLFPHTLIFLEFLTRVFTNRYILCHTWSPKSTL